MLKCNFVKDFRIDGLCWLGILDPGEDPGLFAPRYGRRAALCKAVLALWPVCRSGGELKPFAQKELRRPRSL